MLCIACPKGMELKKWYKHIISIVLSGLNIKLDLKEDTEIYGNTAEFKTEIITANIEVQKWIKDNYIIRIKARRK